MKQIPEFSFRDTIRNTFKGLAGYAACLVFGWMFHDDMSNAIQWPAITMLIGFLGGLTGSRPLCIALYWAIVLADMCGYRIYFWACVGISALFSSYIGINIGSKYGFVLRRAIRRRRSTIDQNPDGSGIEDGMTEPPQSHQIQQAR